MRKKLGQRGGEKKREGSCVLVVGGVSGVGGLGRSSRERKGGRTGCGHVGVCVWYWWVVLSVKEEVEKRRKMRTCVGMLGEISKVMGMYDEGSG